MKINYTYDNSKVRERFQKDDLLNKLSIRLYNLWDANRHKMYVLLLDAQDSLEFTASELIQKMRNEDIFFPQLQKEFDDKGFTLTVEDLHDVIVHTSKRIFYSYRKYSYKYAHKFSDELGYYYILSDKKTKPNRFTAIYGVTNDVPTEYEGITDWKDIESDVLFMLQDWSNLKGEANKNLFYNPRQ